MERSETFRRKVGAVCADGCVLATARTLSAGVIFCGKEVGTPYNLLGDVRWGIILVLIETNINTGLKK